MTCQLPMTVRLTFLVLAIAGATTVCAGVTVEEAAALKTSLTPLGAEKAGNKDGSIPAWDGGYIQPMPGFKAGGRRPDPFAGEQALFSITAKNVEQYADKLGEGSKALFQKYPEYRMDVYPTHRTAAAPQWVYDNTLNNATRARLVGDLVEGAYGGIPFPIPKSGSEVMWNHLLRWRGTSWQFPFNHYQLTADGTAVLAISGLGDLQMPYYFEDGSPEQFARQNEYWMARIVNVGPPSHAGEAIAGRINIDSSKDQAWVYLTGQRRVRKLPNACCDLPAAATSGNAGFDDIEVWSGRLDHFDWKLLGKQELYIPYNGNRLLQPETDDKVLGKHYLNPDFMRWELHRVWVVEATLRQGQRHQVVKSRYYCDEDTWNCALADRWDAKGKLWKTLWSQSYVIPDLPGTVTGAWGFNDLLNGMGFIGALYTSKAAQYPLKPRYPDSVFTPDALTGEGVR